VLRGAVSRVERESFAEMPAPAHMDVPGGAVSHAQDVQARGHALLERAGVAPVTRRGAASGSGGRSRGNASGSGSGLRGGPSGLRGGGNPRRGSSAQRGMGVILPGTDMPDSFQEQQSVEACVRVLDSQTLMAEVACRDNEVSFFAFSFFLFSFLFWFIGVGFEWVLRAGLRLFWVLRVLRLNFWFEG